MEYLDPKGLRVTRVNQESVTVCKISSLELAALVCQVVKAGGSLVLRGPLDHQVLQVPRDPKALKETQVHSLLFLILKTRQTRRGVETGVQRVYQVCPAMLELRARREIRASLALCPLKDASGV